MIIVKLELHSAITHTVKEIGRAVIWNDETGTRELGNYHVALCHEGSTDHERPWKRGRVQSHLRLIDSVWLLVLRGIGSALLKKEILEAGDG